MLAGILIHFVARDYHLCTIVQHKEKLPEKAFFFVNCFCLFFFLSDFWKCSFRGKKKIYIHVPKSFNIYKMGF